MGVEEKVAITKSISNGGRYVEFCAGKRRIQVYSPVEKGLVMSAQWLGRRAPPTLDLEVVGGMWERTIVTATMTKTMQSLSAISEPNKLFS